MDQLAEIAALKAALAAERASPQDSAARQRVIDSARSTTQLLKETGWPIEAIIVMLKQAAYEGGSEYSTDALVQAAVAYFYKSVKSTPRK
jgi:hypothetical protein